MSISSTNRVAGPYSGNGSTTQFPFDFKVFQVSEVRVVRTNPDGVESDMTLGTDYTVALNANQDANPGGTVTAVSAPATGYLLTLTSRVQNLQPVTLTNNGGFYPRVINDALDRLTILVQQIFENLGRALKFPISDGSVNPTLPSRGNRKGRVLAFHETTGDPVQGPSIADVGTVGSNIGNINTVSNNIGNVNTVAGGIGNVNTTANNITSVNTVAGNVDSVNSVAVNMTDVHTVADNIADVTNFADVYLGPRASNPATRTDGSPLQNGDIYFHTGTNRMLAYANGTWYATATAGATDTSLVVHTPAGTGVTPTTVQTELRNIDGSLLDLTQDPAMLAQPLNYLKDSIGLGYADGAMHLNGDLQLGAVRNVLSNTNDLSLIGAVSATKDTTKSIKFQNITMQRAYGNNFYSSLFSNLGGSSVTLTAGKKYLMSCYVINLSDQEKFLWQRSLGAGGDYGHGAKLVDRNVRRIWQLVKATTSTNVDLMPDPTVALGSGPNNSPYWIALNRSSESFDVRIGGFQLEQVPDDAKAGVAVIGDSTVAGSAGKKDLAASTEWTRWAEAQLNVPFFNRGVGGETTANMRARWATDMTPLAVNANYAIIQGGINDIVQGRTLADIQTDIQWMHDQAITDGMQPIVCTCTPTSSIQANAGYETTRQALNVWIKQNFALILDLDKVVRDPSNPSLLRQKTGWIGDGVHFDTLAKRAIGIYVAKWPFWNFIAPSPYQERTGNAALVDPVRAGSFFFLGSGYSNISVAGGGPLNLKNDSRLTAQVLEFSGALTGARTVYFQGYIPKLWFVRNTTSGAFTMDVRGVDATGTAFGPAQFTIGQGKGCWVLSTGSGLVRASADV